MNEEMLNDEVCEKELGWLEEYRKKLKENKEKIGDEIIEFESKIKFFGEIINEDEMEKIFESEVEKIFYGYGIKWYPDDVPPYIEDIIEEVPEDWDDRDEVISDICDRWQEFLEEFARQNFPPELEKVLEIFKQIGFDDDDDFKIKWFFEDIYDETEIDEYQLGELLLALYKAKMLNMEIVDFILSVAKQLVEKKHLTYRER